MSLAGTTKSVGNWTVSRGGIFTAELVYLLAGWTLAILYFTHTIHPRHTVGSMPIGVPWFGALGAVLISLVGIFEHPLDWNPRYALWHWARPFVGASFAIVSVMIIQAGIVSVGANPNQPGKSATLYYIVGFLIGYREETFRELIKRLVDVLLGPGTTTSDSAPTITRVDPAGGPTAGATPVTIDGTGFSKVISVKFGDKDASNVVSESPTRIKATAPAAAAIGRVTVSVTTKAGTATADFTYT